MMIITNYNTWLYNGYFTRFVAILSPDSSLYPANMATFCLAYLRQLVMAPWAFLSLQKRLVASKNDPLTSINLGCRKYLFNLLKCGQLKKKTSRGQIAIFMATNGGSTSISKVESPSHFVGLLKSWDIHGDITTFETTFVTTIVDNHS